MRDHAAAYSYKRDPARAIAAGRAAGEAGYYTRDGVLAVIDWKAARSKPKLERSGAKIRRSTARALAAGNEVERMEAMTSIPGIGVPIGSTLLLFALGESYPILDVNAVTALNHKGRSQYPATFWNRYLTFVRELGQENGMTPREVEKALWEFGRRLRARC